MFKTDTLVLTYEFVSRDIYRTSNKTLTWLYKVDESVSVKLFFPENG